MGNNCLNCIFFNILNYEGDEITGEWKKIHNEELSDLYSPSIFHVIKSGRMRWARHVACTGKCRGVYRVLVGKPEGGRPF
jgi:hypothetical protein